MPFGDRTGPMGEGPMTGRGAGYCTGNGVPGYMNPFGRGFGRGFWGRGYGRGFWGRGRGYRHMYYLTGVPGWARYGYAPVASRPVDEKKFLESEAKALEEELKLIRERLEKLKEGGEK